VLSGIISKFVNALITNQIALLVEMKLTELKQGSKARIEGFKTEDLELKLMEMGCIPGEEITVEQIAPLGGPMNIKVAGYLLSLRLDEAEQILVSV
jgi:ferrous iron transport protein A